MAAYVKHLLLFVGVILAVMLAGCGSGTTPSFPVRGKTPAKATLVKPAPAVVLPGRPCTGNDYYMQCAASIPAVVPPSTLGLGPLTFSQSGYGIDFAWGGPSGQVAKANGAHFGVSYLSLSSKDWNPSTLTSYRNAGLGVVFVWETTAARSLDGWNAGYNDAFNATHELQSRYGIAPAGVHIDFASDYDTTFYGRVFEPYYQGASAWMKRVGGTEGAYGGLHTVNQLCADHIGTLNWQTVAWSGGQRASVSCAPLYQRSINNSLAGYSVDNNDAYAANYGQLGYKAPPVGPSKQQIARWQGGRNSSIAAYRARRCTMPVLGSKPCAVFASRVLYFVTLLDKNQVQKQPVCWGTHAQKGADACQIARPQLSIWNHASTASQRAWLALGCQPAGPQKPITTGKRCGPVYARIGYFHRKGQTLFKAWI
jgi:hypothetical protein